MENAYVILIHKHSSKFLVSNCRPISLKSIACKALKRLVKSEIIGHRRRNKIIGPPSLVLLAGVDLNSAPHFDFWTTTVDRHEVVKIVNSDF